MTRNYSSTTPIVTLTGSVSDTDTNLLLSNVDDVFPAAPFTMILEPDSANEEVVEVTSKNGSANLFTVTRAVDGTTGKAHASGASAIHGVSARDFQESVSSDDITSMVVVSQAEYDALTPPDPTTFYVVL